MTVREIIAQSLNLPVDRITDDLSIGDIPEWNSMANMAIMTAIEKELDIEIPIDDLFDLTNVEAIEAEVEKLTKD